MGWALAIVHISAEEATAVIDPGLIGVGTRSMLMGHLVVYGSLSQDFSKTRRYM